MYDPSEHFRRLQGDILEIAEVLVRQSPPGTTMLDVWEEALSLHRVRYATEVLPPEPDE